MTMTMSNTIGCALGSTACAAHVSAARLLHVSAHLHACSASADGHFEMNPDARAQVGGRDAHGFTDTEPPAVSTKRTREPSRGLSDITNSPARTLPPRRHKASKRACGAGRVQASTRQFRAAAPPRRPRPRLAQQELTRWHGRARQPAAEGTPNKLLALTSSRDFPVRDSLLCLRF